MVNRYKGMRIYSDLRDAYLRGMGLSRQQFADWLGVDRTTVARYERGEGKIPGPVWRAVELGCGHLGALHPDWTGWHLSNAHGLLFAPGYREGLGSGETAFTWWARGHIAAQSARLRELEAQIIRERTPRRSRWIPASRFELVEAPTDAKGEG